MKDDIILSQPLQYTCNVGKGAVKMKDEIAYDNIGIIHTMADGTVRDSVEGYEIPYNEKTAVVYNLIAKWISDKRKSIGDANE